MMEKSKCKEMNLCLQIQTENNISLSFISPSDLAKIKIKIKAEQLYSLSPRSSILLNKYIVNL